MRKEDYSINIFDEKYSVLYVSLMNPIGTILGASSNF
jgi:hypothetical protein